MVVSILLLPLQIVCFSDISLLVKSYEKVDGSLFQNSLFLFYNLLLIVVFLIVSTETKIMDKWVTALYSETFRI